MFRKIPLGAVLLSVGSVLTLVGFVAYFQEQATLNLVGFFYGVPILLGGLALKAAELDPVQFSQPTPPEVEALRSQQATSTQNQIRNDVTRYRYGQEAHLDESLERLGLSPNDDQRPVLVGLRETAIADAYALVLEFESPHVDFDTWQSKQDKVQRFFGPGVTAHIEQLEGDRIDLALIASPPAAQA
ncbi:MAG: DUF2854 domain-containing protein [Leptolyngbyaceae cyanobacterium SM1_1_3]|nr:DUF2854 domain-containing protein [Leptolyngbyaceae cyanobacterium SM1_1_3]NJN02342.1 DUF2854 domain-containing protein [Leptolyngbyaceae cyanobacterium RM1_1_2]NJO11728.1 DUF2854 domain-containing protein [Leptolyngbyaceae cyanobacterium SL_1_1]